MRSRHASRRKPCPSTEAYAFIAIPSTAPYASSSGSVSVRTRGKGDQGSMPLADFIAKATELVDMQSMEL